MKTLVLGLDGATFRVLDRYRSQLPTLDRLLSDGYSAELESSYPATTSVAWPSMATGQNPAKFGLADFMYRDPETLEFHLNDARRKPFDFFWEYMDESIGLASVPIIPYHNVDGFFIQGSLAHIDSDRVTKPATLADRIPSGYDYSIDWRDGPEELLNGLLGRVDARREVFLHLVRNYELPMYFLEFDAIDRIQHHFWAYMDEGHPNHEPSEYDSAIRDVWQRIDESIDAILSEFDEEINVVVVSDHGFRPCHTEVNISALLRQAGHLSYDVDSVDSIFSQAADLTKQYIGREIINRLIPKRLQQQVAKNIPSHERVGDIIDWEKTTAYSFGVTANVFLNLDGRESKGTVPADDYERVRETVANTLESFVDEQRGVSPIQVIRKEEVYEGPYIDYVPDLVIQTSEGYKAKSDVGTEVIHRKQGVMPNSGIHEREGIFIATGPQFTASGRATEAHEIVDIAPTLLHMYDYRIPVSMDGAVVSDALRTGRNVERGESTKGERQRIRNRILSLKQLKEV